MEEITDMEHEDVCLNEMSFGELASELLAVDQEHSDLQDCLVERAGEHNSEVALHGDSWPGAVQDIQKMGAALSELTKQLNYLRSAFGLNYLWTHLPFVAMTEDSDERYNTNDR
tara:strand:- start:50 stop:391 length:342 start_codon:yes stop_codon:yes gene_type:complete